MTCQQLLVGMMLNNCLPNNAINTWHVNRIYSDKPTVGTLGSRDEVADNIWTESLVSEFHL